MKPCITLKVESIASIVSKRCWRRWNMIKRVIMVLALITAFLLGYFCGLLCIYEEVKAEESEVMLYEPEPLIMTVKEEAPEVILLGEFKVTAYCPCVDCSEGWGKQTSTGAIAQEGRTIAVDPKVIPYGNEVVIDGHTYRAEDCGGLITGNRIDIFFESHKDVDAWGLQTHNVFLKCEVEQ
jgi:3D (Asp-Asp-Asp) domain-containing protein